MLREILAITGRPGLFRLLKQGRNSLIVEDLQTKNRISVQGRDKIVSLGDIAMYTDEDDVALGEVLDRLYAHEEGKPVDLKALVAGKKLREEFDAVLPTHDHDRVHDSDIKKLFQWYNLLLAAGFTKFAEEEEEAAGEAASEEKPAE